MRTAAHVAVAAHARQPVSGSGMVAGPRLIPCVKRCRPRDDRSRRSSAKAKSSSTLASWVAAIRSNIPYQTR